MIASTSELDAVNEPIVADLAEEFLRRIHAGERVTPESFAARTPEHAEELRQILPAVAALAGFHQVEFQAVPRGEGVATIDVLGDFKIRREIGRGGMGVVYEAEQTSLGRRVALKVLLQNAANDPRRLERFQVEAHAVAALSHPNIVPIFAVGADQGQHYYAMQFIEGRSLAELIAGCGSEPEDGLLPCPRLSPMEVARLGLQAADAVSHAHSMGILHRDIKPANMLVDDSGHLWIVDFGLAHPRRERPDSHRRRPWHVAVHESRTSVGQEHA